MTDEQGFRELGRDMELEAISEKLNLAEKYFTLGCQAGLIQALEDALKARNLVDLIEGLTARVAPTIGGEQ